MAAISSIGFLAVHGVNLQPDRRASEADFTASAAEGDRIFATIGTLAAEPGKWRGSSELRESGSRGIEAVFFGVRPGQVERPDRKAQAFENFPD